MSIKKFLIILFLITILISLALFAFVSNNYIDKYFNEYIDSEYLENVENLREYAAFVIKEGFQPRNILNSYIKDPIYYAEIHDEKGTVVAFSGMMMHNSFVFDPETMIAEGFDITDGGAIIGKLLIARENDTAKTETHRLFHQALLNGAVLSVVLTLLGIGAIMFFLVRYIGKNVDSVVNYAAYEGERERKYKILELNTITDAIQNYKMKLAHKERVKKQSFDRLLHETKTPVTIVKSILEGIDEGVIKVDKDKVDAMLEAMGNLDNLLKDIPLIIEGGNTEEEVLLQNVDYSIELKKLVKSLSNKFQNKGIRLVLKNEKLSIKTNKDLLNAAIYNLLINSYKYTEHGEVKIIVSNKNKSISIKDTGIGIATEDLADIFKPYFRGRNVGDIGGDGIGLSIAKENIEKCGGRISVESEINRYTEYIISFD